MEYGMQVPPRGKNCRQVYLVLHSYLQRMPVNMYRFQLRAPLSKMLESSWPLLGLSYDFVNYL